MYKDLKAFLLNLLKLNKEKHEYYTDLHISMHVSRDKEGTYNIQCSSLEIGNNLQELLNQGKKEDYPSYVREVCEKFYGEEQFNIYVTSYLSSVFTYPKNGFVWVQVINPVGIKWLSTVKARDRKELIKRINKILDCLSVGSNFSYEEIRELVNLEE